MIDKEARLLKYFSDSMLSKPIPKWADPMTVETLHARKYLAVNILGTHGHITDEGLKGLSEYYDIRSDRRWTRGLAIAAIVISLAALALELDDRGMLGGLLNDFRTNPSSRQHAVQSSSD